MKNVFIWFIQKFNEHRITIHAAQVAFFIIISFFPFVMFLFTLLHFTPITETELLSLLEMVLPVGIRSTVSNFLLDSLRSSSGTILSITVIATLWAGSKGFASISYEMDCIYEVQNHRGFFYRRFLALFDTILFAAMIVISLVLLVYGNQLIHLIDYFFPFFSQIDIILFILRSAVSFLLFVVYFTFLYRFLPHRKSTFRAELPGAVLSAFLWIVFSYLYSIYIDYQGSFSSVYGSLTYLVLLMLWVYFCIIFIFLGAMLNQYLHKYEKLHLISDLKQFKMIVRLYLENKI